MKTSSAAPPKLNIFVCYHRKVRSLVVSLLKWLYAAVDIVIDEADWGPGDSLPNKTNDSIDEADYMLAFFSKDCLKSPHILNELTLAEQRTAHLQRGFVIPVLLLDFDKETLPDFLKKDDLIHVEVAKDDDFMVHAKSLELLSGILKLAGKHVAQQKLEVRHGKKFTSRQLTGVHIQSLGRFHRACMDVDEGTFFNVNVSMDEWFHPNLQVHLAVQQGIVHGRLLQAIRSPENSKQTTVNRLRGPFSRVMFLPTKSSDLEWNLRSSVTFSRQFRSFAHIHNLMACPLAVVPADLFLIHLVRPNTEFFRQDVNMRILGLPPTLGQLAEDSGEDWLKQATDLLVNNLKTNMQDVPAGHFQPCMDFALFRKDAAALVWFGAVDRDYAVTYAEDPSKLIGVVSHVAGTIEEIKRCLTTFGTLVEQLVFREREISKSERYAIKRVLAINPSRQGLPLLKGTDMQEILGVREDFCAWQFIHRTDSDRHRGKTAARR